MKPHNIFICRDADGSDIVKVLDFGIAKVAGTEDGLGLAETTRLTAPGGVLGTPPYMSPEQCRGESLTPASDFYSLGIVLYELVTGHVPFDDPSAVQVLVMHNTAPLPPLPSDFASYGARPGDHAIVGKRSAGEISVPPPNSWRRSIRTACQCRRRILAADLRGSPVARVPPKSRSTRKSSRSPDPQASQVDRIRSRRVAALSDRNRDPDFAGPAGAEPLLVVAFMVVHAFAMAIDSLSKRRS